MNGSPSPQQRVFLVADQPVFRMGLRSLLGPVDGLVICGEAQDGSSACAGIQKDPPPDLVIIDLNNGVDWGIEILRPLKLLVPGLRVLCLAGRGADTDIERVLRAGADGYLSKDSPPDKIIEATLRVLRGGLVVPEQDAEHILRRLVGGQHEQSFEEDRLSERERDVFNLMGHGVSTRECAEKLSLSIKTVEAYQSSIKRKLSLKDGNQLRRRAVLWVSQRSNQSPRGGRG